MGLRCLDVGCSQLGLLLGFSFAIAGARQEARRELLVKEANSIGTTALRAKLLPEPHTTTTRKRSAELQDRMWTEAVAAAAERPSSITATFITSLNETIDLEATRISAKRNHVPGAVWLLLLCVAGCGLWLVSYQAGTSQRHSILERLVFPVLVAIVITLITDIDTPRGGLISLDERPLLELNAMLRGSSTSATP